MNFIKDWELFFLNLRNSKTTETYNIVNNLTDKINLKRSEKYVAL